MGGFARTNRQSEIANRQSDDPPAHAGGSDLLNSFERPYVGCLVADD
jgi:hypothetical protein